VGSSCGLFREFQEGLLGCVDGAVDVNQLFIGIIDSQEFRDGGLDRPAASMVLSRAKLRILAGSNALAGAT